MSIAVVSSVGGVGARTVATPSAQSIAGPPAVTTSTATYRFSAHERVIADTQLRFVCAIDAPKPLDTVTR
jgi:hypothetical protein